MIIELVEELGVDAYVHGHSPEGNRLVVRAYARIHPAAGLGRARPADQVLDVVPADAAVTAATLG